MAGKRSPAEYRGSRQQLERALKKLSGVKILADSQPDHPLSRRSLLIEADPRIIHSHHASLHRDVLIEPEIHCRLHAGGAAALKPRTFRADVKGGGAGLPSARVTLMYPSGNALGTVPPKLTDHEGKAAIDFLEPIDPTIVLAEPAGGFWGMHSDFRSAVTVSCPALPDDGPLGWWHREAGITGYDENRGAGMRIGVVGTGVGPNPCLTHVTRIDGKTDVARHDTHVAGVLCARPVAKGQFAGIAPGARVFSVRVFKPGPAAEPVAEHQGVIAHAIDVLARPEKHGGYEVDLINLSFGEPTRSAILQDAIRHAFEHGVLCVCSAGNNLGGAIDYPAAFPETVAVTALGLAGWGPERSITRHWTPTQRSMFGRRNLFLTALSSTGKGVFCAAPGSGIISTMPSLRGSSRGKSAKAPYAAMDGTSIAAPMACGVLAVLLAGSRKYRSLARNAARARFAKQKLRAACVSVGLKKEFEGAGVPQVR